MNRELRVAEVIKQEIATIIQQKLNDNRIGFVSITEVIVTRDLSFATVHVSTFGNDKDRERAISGLEHATGFIKKELGRVLKLRIIPNLKFVDDRSIERGCEIIAKLNELKKATHKGA